MIKSDIKMQSTAALIRAAIAEVAKQISRKATGAAARAPVSPMP